MLNPLTTIGNGSFPNQNLHIHINDSSLAVVARNILILKIISSQDFDPNNTADMSYTWDLWYNTIWPESTLERFMKGIKSLLDEPLPGNIILADTSQEEKLNSIWRTWITNIDASVDGVLAKRYIA